MQTTTRPASRFETCLNVLMRNEGGYVDHPADPGGATNLGISLRFLRGELAASPALATDLGYAPGHVPTAADIRALTTASAALVYRRCFWDRLRCDTLPAPIDAAVFDFGVNAGTVTAVKLLQRAVNVILPGAVTVDGIMGPGTARAALRCGAPLIGQFRFQAAAYYRAIAAKNPSLQAFLKGWLARAARLGTV